MPASWQDTLDEFAFCLDLLLGPLLVARAASLVVTGAMKPHDVEGYDGRANLQQAVQVAVSRHAAGYGVLVALNDSVHMARYVTKADSQLMGAFRSHPGPVGQVREGRVRFYCGPPPDVAEAPLADERFAALEAGTVGRWSRVGIWVTGVDAFVPEGLLRGVCGLVLAAPGTGSLPAALIEALAPWTSTLPIAIVSRCGVGNNYDDCYYRGSRDKYERRGFLLAGFEHCTPMQARHLLVLRLAAGAYPQYATAVAVADVAAKGGGRGEGGAGRRGTKKYIAEQRLLGPGHDVPIVWHHGPGGRGGGGSRNSGGAGSGRGGRGSGSAVLRGNADSGGDAPEEGLLPSLTSLSAYECLPREHALIAASGCTQLRALGLSMDSMWDIDPGTPLRESWLNRLAHMTHLRALELTDASLAAMTALLPALTGLTNLRLKSTKAHVLGASLFTGLAGLQMLQVAPNSLSVVALDKLTALTYLALDKFCSLPHHAPTERYDGSLVLCSSEQHVEALGGLTPPQCTGEHPGGRLLPAVHDALVSAMGLLARRGPGDGGGSSRANDGGSDRSSGLKVVIRYDKCDRVVDDGNLLLRRPEPAATASAADGGAHGDAGEGAAAVERPRSHTAWLAALARVGPTELILNRVKLKKVDLRCIVETMPGLTVGLGRDVALTLWGGGPCYPVRSLRLLAGLTRLERLKLDVWSLLRAAYAKEEGAPPEQQRRQQQQQLREREEVVVKALKRLCCAASAASASAASAASGAPCRLQAVLRYAPEPGGDEYDDTTERTESEDEAWASNADDTGNIDREMDSDWDVDGDEVSDAAGGGGGGGSTSHDIQQWLRPWSAWPRVVLLSRRRVAAVGLDPRMLPHQMPVFQV
ncbi:hypothetical protein GPECTOR_87g410 [Gonium pectorale]|uniref:asparaginase n=1 Tax=Gonium pectorale TaxID=33097 RepID=A0A150G136_GONPE|nr:hypothetical protein GPECTOR_87g410 [Gonium pectorale]|eukprot:KXZ43548.1 hypothetical protein GPECTOR_87g410 [Gonium pectorale]